MDSAEFLDLLGNANRRRILRLLAHKPCYVTEISEQIGVSPKAVIDHLRKLEDAGLVESRTDDRQRKYFSISQHVSLEVTVSPYRFGTRSAYPSSGRPDIGSCQQVSIELESRTIRRDSNDDTGSTADLGSDKDTDASHANGNSADNSGHGAGEMHTPASPAGAESPEGNGNRSGRGRPAREGPTPENEGEGRSESREDSPDRGSQAEAATLARQLREFEQLERELSLLHRWAEGRITGLRERLADQVDVAEPRLVSEALVALAEEPHRTEQLCGRLGAPPSVVEELLELLASEGVVRREKRRWRLRG